MIRWCEVVRFFSLSLSPRPHKRCYITERSESPRAASDAADARRPAGRVHAAETSERFELEALVVLEDLDRLCRIPTPESFFLSSKAAARDRFRSCASAFKMVRPARAARVNKGSCAHRSRASLGGAIGGGD